MKSKFQEKPMCLCLELGKVVLLKRTWDNIAIVTAEGFEIHFRGMALGEDSLRDLKEGDCLTLWISKSLGPE